MSDIIPNVVVSMPSQLFTLARKFQAASNGKIYIGKIDTDPTIPENQIQVYLENEDGSTIPVAQPIIINQAGYPVYNGQIAKFVTVEGHSMAVYDSYGAQQFYYPNVLKYDPDQFDKRFREELKSSSGSGLSGFSHDVQYVPATVGHKLKNSVWVTDSPFNAKMDGVTDDTIAFQKAIDSGKIVQIPTGDTVVSNLTIYPNTTIIGCGRRHGIHVESGTQILYKGSVGNDWLTLADRVGMSRDGQGGVTLKAFTCINASDYLELPSKESNPYYLYNPNGQKVLDSNSRGLFAVESTPVEWGGHTDWRASKDGGVNCPFLIIDDVKLQNFTYPIDVHTWMCQISNFESYLCGPIRISGTSTHITTSWPRKPLSVSWQLGCSYSNMTASSLGEDVYLETANGGVECYFGYVSLDDVGYELVRGTVINAYKGTVKVNGLSGVTGSTNRPGRLGKISGPEGFIVWGNIPKMENRNGEQITLAFSLFTAINESLLANHIFEGTSLAKNSWVTNPWESKLGSSNEYEYFAPYVSQPDSAIIGSPYIIYPTKENKFREVGCLNIGYKNSVIVRGAGKVHRFRIYGGFDDGVTSASSTNPRQKHGMLRVDFTHYVSPLSNGVTSASDNYKSTYAILSFSKTIEGMSFDTVLGDNVSSGNDKPIFFKVTQESDGGFLVEFGVTNRYDGNDAFRQCLLDIKYSGSYPRNADNNTVLLSIQV
ncbi:phage tailspike protein [Providencia alcalifaciens]|uniref:phage tailspike protein n=1 Tax=Providencia alcalifaciens TaxID=126385 RepID=UPI001CC59129|nr:phage tailspike protein [Providencia alcalifaciens]CAG9416849.1 hypothetical protein NVI2019_PLFLNFOB_01451 [Providencia alcalifaciens]CAG9420141.1 hypothetical protein NVI2019_OHEONHNH_01870 [Providencia alcalifaciens]CAG9424157.1 hypothetical protein NVI2019_KOLGMIGM_02366 [Providencia alcalifaciens]CAG9425161.1 hypothetical protein NVI2019_OGMBKCAO_02366 [Providencia alcalifaciens]CAG9425463.1 hypothetical protein NVI2019_ANGEOOBF_02365 [Providencia alcalifaciens]